MSTSGSVVGRVARRGLGRSPLVAVLALTLAGCTGAATPDATTPATGGTGTAAPPHRPAAALTTGAASAPASPSAAAGRGCPSTGATVPEGAASAPTVDLDGDGAADTLWLSAGVPRILGVRTHSGAVFSVGVLQRGAPGGAGPGPAARRRLGGHPAQHRAGGAALRRRRLRDRGDHATSRATSTPSTSASPGTAPGWRARTSAPASQLVGLQRDQRRRRRAFDVTRTPIELSGAGTRATNGRDHHRRHGRAGRRPGGHRGARGHLRRRAGPRRRTLTPAARRIGCNPGHTASRLGRPRASGTMAR